MNRKLPYKNTPVSVTYLPNKAVGDRISIFKDQFGYLNFYINDHYLMAPIHWAKSTWHRIKASYKVNNGRGRDEMHLFIDGYHYGNLTYGNQMYGGPAVYGAAYPGDGYGLLTNITVKDNFNQFYIGGDFNEKQTIFGLIDNVRISNINRPIYKPYGEPIDINYNSNLSVIYPVTSDLYTTYLLESDLDRRLNEDFVVLKNKNNGLFDFEVNIIDSFDIVSGSARVKQILEKLIKTLKPANSRVFIDYLK